MLVRKAKAVEEETR